MPPSLRALSRSVARSLCLAPCVPIVACVCSVGCLPNGPPTGSPDAGAAGQLGPKTTAQAAQKRTPTPRPPASIAALAEADPAIEAPFVDAFDRADLGPDWRALGSSWRITDGKLCGQKARNRGVWLARRLPTNARVEVEAQSASPDGDLKLELWGDGLSGATSISYSNATSYLAILGGWKNSLHVLARLDEHGADRRQLRLDPADDDPRARPLSPGQIYRLRIERTDGRTVALWVDDALVHRMTDAEPLAGPGHDHLGFNDWETPVCFDNLRVTPLPG